MNRPGACLGRRALLLLPLLGIAACAGPTGVRPADVAVYHVPPSQAYEFVANVETDSVAPTRSDALAALRERAAAVGANGVIVRDRSNGPLRGIAIRVRDR
ncbi:MAG: hypothetical protein R3298_01370 [Gammaproteobacteria bacterium]|nr:hypothetical protein [Gammaproteobacteria bacterium]